MPRGTRLARHPGVRLATILLGLGLLVPCASVCAQDAPTSALELDGHLGWTEGCGGEVFTGGEAVGGATVGVAGRGSLHGLTAGLGLQWATALFENLGSASLLAGLGWPAPWTPPEMTVDWLRGYVIGEVGLNAYAGIHRGFLNDDPGTGAVLPFVGVRTSLLVRAHRGKRGRTVWLGFTVGTAEDLETRSKTYAWRDTGTNWFSGAPYDELNTTTVVLGQSRWTLLGTTTIVFGG